METTSKRVFAPKGLPETADELWVEIPHSIDARGGLGFVEAGKDVPFAFKRAYYLFDVKAARGAHAHKALWQLFLPLGGSFKMKLDDGVRVHEVVLDNPIKGIVVGPGVWRDLTEFSEGAVCMVLASEWYDEADYIRNYDDFIKMVRG